MAMPVALGRVSGRVQGHGAARQQRAEYGPWQTGGGPGRRFRP